jgi:hypothetical protein
MNVSSSPKHRIKMGSVGMKEGSMIVDRRPSPGWVLQAVVVVAATCIGSIALGTNLDEQKTPRSKLTLLEGRSPCEIRKAKEICESGVAPETKRHACLYGGGTKYALGNNPCWHYTGHCTSSGAPQCVTGPSAQSPDATAITQCCTGGSQYPWIDVCPGQQPSKGCSFCLF